MIYQLYCALIMAGYSAVGLLMGSYMIFYAEAREIDLGYLFMLQPMCIFLRPFICAQADRYQSHKQLLSVFALVTSLAYLPFILIPFLIMDEHFEESLTPRRRFWILVASHMVGSVGFCGVRSLGDALAVNYAKRVGSAFARYRKYGAISFGVCGYLLGQINQNWVLPNFVPSFIVYSVSFFTLSVLVYSWPAEYFQMKSRNDDQNDPENEEINQKRFAETEFSNGEQILAHMSRKLCCCCWLCIGPASGSSNDLNNNVANGNKLKHISHYGDDDDDHHHHEKPLRPASLTIWQQVRIFFLLLKRDFRIPLYLLVIFYGGLVGYAGPNFVFTYMHKVCRETKTCDASSLAGLVMISYCTVETIGYILIDKFGSKVNRVLMFELTFISLAVHYYFYAYVLDHVSPYFFLVESLHGLEYSISLATTIDLGYDFGSEVEYLMPELIAKGIISEQDDERLVKVSLMATMSGCCTLVYDGVGCILGSFIYGQITGHYGYNTTWLMVGTVATVGFFGILIIYLIGKCLAIRPRILKLKEQYNQIKAKLTN